MLRTYAYLMVIFLLTVPTAAIAGRLHYSGNSWIASNPINGSSIEDNSLIHHVAEPWHDRFGTYFELGNKERMNEAVRDREKGADSAGIDARSYDTFLGPSFDIPDSVDGHSRAADPWLGRQSLSDPMVQDFSRMDGGGFSSPSHAGGSAPGSYRR